MEDLLEVEEMFASHSKEVNVTGEKVADFLTAMQDILVVLSFLVPERVVAVMHSSVANVTVEPHVDLPTKVLTRDLEVVTLALRAEVEVVCAMLFKEGNVIVEHHVDSPMVRLVDFLVILLLAEVVQVCAMLSKEASAIVEPLVVLATRTGPLTVDSGELHAILLVPAINLARETVVTVIHADIPTISKVP